MIVQIQIYITEFNLPTVMYEKSMAELVTYQIARAKSLKKNNFTWKLFYLNNSIYIIL